MFNKAKKVIVISFVMLLVFILVGCNEQNQELKEKSAWEKIEGKGRLVVATSPDYPPFETVDEKGKIIGFDVDLINEIGKELGLKIELKEMSFDTIITAVQNGQIDIGISGFSITEDRCKSVNMSKPYLIGGQVILTTVDSGVKGPEDLKGEKVAAGMGSTCEQAAMTIEGAELVSLDDHNIGFIMLKNGSVKAVVADISVADDYISKEKRFVIVGKPLAYEETAIIMKKGNDELTDIINDAIEKIKTKGIIIKLKDKWGIK